MRCSISLAYFFIKSELILLADPLTSFAIFPLSLATFLTSEAFLAFFPSLISLLISINFSNLAILASGTEFMEATTRSFPVTFSPDTGSLPVAALKDHTRR